MSREKLNRELRELKDERRGLLNRSKLLRGKLKKLKAAYEKQVRLVEKESIDINKALQNTELLINDMEIKIYS